MGRLTLNPNGERAVYLPLGTVALPAEVAAHMRELAKIRPMAALVRAALIATYCPELVNDPPEYRQEDF